MVHSPELIKLEQEGKATSRKAKRLALEAYNEGPEHPRYWNDRFYLAVRFNLSKRLQKQAFVNSIISNGKKGYFELETSAGYDNEKLLFELGVGFPKNCSYLKSSGKDFFLPEGLIKFLAEKFKVDLENKEKLIRLSELGVGKTFRVWNWRL